MIRDQIHWTKALYGTGVDDIDDQHKILFEKINALIQGVDGRQAKAALDKLVEDLGGFTRMHFGFEENLMETRKCSSCQRNKQAHAWFLTEYAELKRRLDSEGPTDQVAEKAANLLMGWIRSHIMCIDTKLRETV